MLRTMLRDEQWTKIRSIWLELNNHNKVKLRQIVECIFCHMKIDYPWLYFSGCLGKFITCYKLVSTEMAAMIEYTYK